MKKYLLHIGAVFLMALLSLPALAQLNSGYYRVRNAAEGQTNQYMSFANDIINFNNIIAAPGGATNLTNEENRPIYVPYAMSCVDTYLKNDIHLTEANFIDPSSVIYIKLKNNSAQTYNLISQGTSLNTLTTGWRWGSNGNVYFHDIFAIINQDGTDEYNKPLYRASVPLTIKATGKKWGLELTLYNGTLTNCCIEDLDGTLHVEIQDSIASFTNNYRWYIEPLTCFNVQPDKELNGKYYTTLKVPFQSLLDANNSSVKKAYVITGVSNGILQYQELTGTIPAGTAVLLECDSNIPADCKLFFPKDSNNRPLEPKFTAADENAYVGDNNSWSPSLSSVDPADETDYYAAAGNTNLLKGTYYSNTDGTMRYNTTSGVNAGYFYGNHYTAPTNLFELGTDNNGKMGFVEAHGITTPQNIQAMPANKAWMEQSGVFRSAATPTISPASGSYGEAQTVTISTTETDATIHYTTDGSVPTWESPVYNGPFTVEESATVKAIAIKEGLYNASDVAEATYTITVSNPTLTATPTSLTIAEAGGSFTVEGSDLGTDNAGVTRTNGAFVPSLTASTGTATNGDANWYFTPSNGSLNGTVNVTYQGRELVDQTTFNVANNVASAEPVTVTYRPDIYLYGDFGNGWTYGDQMQYNNGVYTAQVNATTTTFLLFARKAGETYNPWNDNRYFFGPKTDGNDWLYVQDKTDELDVNANVGGQYHPFELPEGKYTITINAADKTFTITRTIETVATPTFTPAAGTYTSIQNVTIACDTQGAVIHYTTDGSEPTANSPVYSGAIEVAQNMTIKAIAMKDGWNPSQMASAEYVINLPQLAAPTFSPAAGTYTEAQTVTITAENDAAIEYSIDGGSTWQTYSAPISVTETCTIMAKATKQGYTDSQTASATYTIKYPVAIPTFNPAAGTYNGTQHVTIKCETQDATIYYKIDDGEYQIYEDPIEVGESCTITAKATKDGWTDSSEASAEYVINHPTLTIAPESLNINDEGGKFTVNGTYVDGNINVGFANNTDWYLNPETLSNTGGEVNVTYTGRALRAQNTVNAQAANNSSLTASGSVNYKSDIYIVTDNGAEGNWHFDSGIQMTDNDGIYTTTFTAPADNTFILFARMLGDGVNWNTRYVFGPVSDNDWTMPDDKVTENGNIDLYDDDPIKLPYAGDYMITIDATDPDHPTFTISRALAESTLADIESSGVVGKAYTVSDELIGVWAVNIDNTKLLWAKDQGNVSIDKRPAKTDDQTDYMVTHMKYQHYPWDGYDWDESNWAILDFSALDEDPETFVGHKLTERSVSGIYRDANDYTIKLSEAPDMANGSENTFDADDYPGYAGVHSENNYGTKYDWAYNTYIPANFNEDNLNRLVDGVIVGAQSGPNALDNMQDQQLYFMNPKFMEIAHIWGIWEDNGANGRFVMIEPSFANNQTVNAWDLHGAVDVINWNYNRKDQNNYGQPHQLTEGAHDFHALIVRKSTGNKLTSDPSSGIYGIMPLDLPENGHPTAVKELIGNRVIKSISYYNVMGMESSRPFKGINIVVTRYSDGSSTTTKVLR